MSRARPLAAAVLLMVGFGSIHAFSVFLAPLEQLTGAPRGQVSLVYSLALVSLTTAVLLSGSALAGPPGRTALVACFGAAVGLAVAAAAPPLLLAQLGYGVLFGAANGLAYALSLAIASSAAPDRAGFWLATVTAAYAIGAGISAWLLNGVLGGLGWRGCLALMACLFAALGVVALVLLRAAKLPAQTRPAGEAGRADRALLLRLWLAYGVSVAAGLLVIGHAAGLIERAGGTRSTTTLAIVLVGLGNAAGGAAAALLADRVPAGWLLALISAVSLGGLVALQLDGTSATVSGLASVGLAYGAHIAVFPEVVREAFGTSAFGWAYGRVFTAWGLAGLAAPWLAGALYDSTADYRLALLLASVVAASGLALNVALPSGADRR